MTAGDDKAEPRLSVVVPAYMEAGVIGPTVTALRQEFEASGSGPAELIVVDDGSLDGTYEEALASPADRVIRLERHRGKGAAVRAGMLAARGRTAAFCDADLAYAPDQVTKLVRAVESGTAAVVTGSRRHVDAVTLVRAGRLREVSGRAFSALTDALVVGARRDTQCGVKAFSQDAAQAIFSRARLDGFAFDVEIFVLADRLGLSVSEVPVELTNSRRSTVHVARQAAVMIRDVLRIRYWDARGLYRPERGGR